MIHIATGNDLEVVYTYEGDKQVLKGLYRRGTYELIPLENPVGLWEVLGKIISECGLVTVR